MRVPLSSGLSRTRRLTRIAVSLVMVMTALGTAAPLAQADPIIPVRSLYLVPSDRTPNAAYGSAIDAAFLDLQSWYSDQLGGSTFAVANPNVQIVSTPHPASYYSTPGAFPSAGDFFFNVFGDAAAFGATFDDPAFRWAVYIDADPAPGQFGGAALGAVTVLGAPDLRGLIGQEPAPVSRWIGGLGHELGHTFGLPHPSACVGTPVPSGCEGLRAFGPLNYPSSVIDGSLMQFGYLTYPNTYFLSEEREFLRSTSFFAQQPESPAPVPEPSTLVLTLSALAGGGLFRKRRQIFRL